MSLVMLAVFDITLIETVGVGQREIDVADMCDTTCYVAQPGSGDSVQFLKAGILEVPHILVVNKEDMGAVARRTLSELGAANLIEQRRHHYQGKWILKRLHEEFGSNGLTRLGGVDSTLEQLQTHSSTLFEQDEALRQRLL